MNLLIILNKKNREIKIYNVNNINFNKILENMKIFDLNLILS